MSIDGGFPPFLLCDVCGTFCFAVLTGYVCFVFVDDTFWALSSYNITIHFLKISIQYVVCSVFAIKKYFYNQQHGQQI